MSVDKPYLPQLCSPADPKVALWNQLLGQWWCVLGLAGMLRNSNLGTTTELQLQKCFLGWKLQHLGTYTLFLETGWCLWHPFSGSHGCSGWGFKRVIHITVVYPCASCSWDLVSDQGDEKHGSASASVAGRIKIFLNLRIPTILFPLLHVYYWTTFLVPGPVALVLLRSMLSLAFQVRISSLSLAKLKIREME